MVDGAKRHPELRNPRSAALPREDPTVVVPRGAAANRAQQASGSVATAPAGSEDALKRLRCAHSNGDSTPPTERYQVQHPANGTTRSQPPRSVRTPRRAEVASRPAPATAPSDEVDTHFRFAEALLERGNYREAVFEAQKAMRLGQPRPVQQALYAWLLYQRAGASAHVHPHVWAHLREALEAEPACARALYYMGMLLARTGRLADARAHLERVRALEPNDADARRALDALAAKRTP